MGKQTSLFDLHNEQKALMVPFAGWDMPLHYGSQVAEHNAVREDSGIFDVSHMGIIDVQGSDSKKYLEYLLANDVGKLKAPGRALYSCMLNQEGGVLDDLIVYYLEDNYYRLVVNAGTTDSDYAWIEKHAKDFDVILQHKMDLSILAIQGPKARLRVAECLSRVSSDISNLKPFAWIKDEDYLIARTGYTGEDGLEIILPNNKATELWKTLSITPIGLGARDTLRLEAGFCLYSQDMDTNVTPLVSNLAWTVALNDERDFIGRKALLTQKENGLKEQLVGLLLEDKGVLRAGYVLYDGESQVGKFTSGSYSPTLKKSIGLARVKLPIKENYTVEIRGKHLLAKVVKLPFVKKGSSLK